MKRLSAPIIGALLYSGLGCGHRVEQIDSGLHEAKELLSHTELGRVVVRKADSTDQQHDFVYLGAGVSQERERCRFLRPAVENESTPWPPVQAAWAVYKDAVISALPATYPGLSDLQHSSIKGEVTGFRYLSFLERQMVTVKNPQISNEEDELTLSIVLPTDMVQVVDGDRQLQTVRSDENIEVELSAKLAADMGSCNVAVAYCIAGIDCTRQGYHREIHQIEVEMSNAFIPAIQSVVIR